MTWDELFQAPGPDRHYDDRVLGPIQKADACLLAAVCNYMRPEAAIEYGCLEGHSAAVLARFCKRLFCVEIDHARQGLCHVIDKNPNITHVHASMTEWVPPEDVKDIGLVYFDASHKCEDSLAAYDILEFRLSPTALLICHDTGDWCDPYPNEDFKKFTARKETVDGEREFVRCLFQRGWQAIAFGCTTQFRHGLTILQRSTGWK